MWITWLFHDNIRHCIQDLTSEIKEYTGTLKLQTNGDGQRINAEGPKVKQERVVQVINNAN